MRYRIAESVVRAAEAFGNRGKDARLLHPCLRLFVHGPSIVDPDGRRSSSRLEREEIVRLLQG
jgi:hypothetical protein